MAAEQQMPPEEDKQIDSPLAKLLDEADAKMAAGGGEMAEGAAEMGAGDEMMEEGEHADKEEKVDEALMENITKRVAKRILMEALNSKK